MSRLRWPDSTNSVSDDPGTVHNAYQKVAALIPKIGIPTTGSNFSLTSIKLMFVPH